MGIERFARFAGLGAAVVVLMGGVPANAAGSPSGSPGTPSGAVVLDRAQAQRLVGRLPTGPATTSMETLGLATVATGAGSERLSVELSVSTGRGRLLGDFGVPGLSLFVSSRGCTSEPCPGGGAPVPLVSVTDRAAALRAVTVRRSATQVRVTGRLPRSVLSVGRPDAIDVRRGLPLDVTVTLPEGHLTAPTDALTTGAVLVRDAAGTRLEWEGNRQVVLPAGKAVGSVGPFPVAAATGYHSRLWKDVRTRSGTLGEVRGSAAAALLNRALDGTFHAQTLVDLTADGALASTSGWRLPGTRHVGHFGAYLDGTLQDWVADSAEFKSDIRSFDCASGSCTEVPVTDDGYGGLGVDQTFEVYGAIVRFGLGMQAAGGVVPQSLQVGVGVVQPTLRIDVSSPRAGVLAYRQSVRFVTTSGTYTGTLGPLPATAVVRTPLWVDSVVDEWEVAPR